MICIGNWFWGNFSSVDVSWRITLTPNTLKPSYRVGLMDAIFFSCSFSSVILLLPLLMYFFSLPDNWNAGTPFKAGTVPYFHWLHHGKWMTDQTFYILQNSKIWTTRWNVLIDDHSKAQNCRNEFLEPIILLYTC